MKTKSYLLLNVLLFFSFSAFSQGAGNFVKYEKKGSDLLIHGTFGDLKIQAFTNNIFKVQVIKPSQTSFDSSYTVILKPTATIGNIIESTNVLEIPFEKCSLVVNKFPLQVSLKSANQIKIQEDKSFAQTLDSLYLSFTINPKDIFRGGGGVPDYADGVNISHLILNKSYLRFYNGTNFAPSFCVPFVISSQKYGLFFDSNMPGFMEMDLGFSDATKINIDARSSGKWAYYLINGDTNDEILYNYTLLTGRQPLPPRWAFGYIQSGSYRNQRDATVPIDLLHIANFPVNALEMDNNWYGGSTKVGNLDWDNTNWNNAPQIISDFAKSGVKTILVADPYLSTQSSNFYLADSLCAKNDHNQVAIIKDNNRNNSAVLDIFKPATQVWLGQNYKRLMNQGVSAWETNAPTIAAADSVNYILGNGFQLHNLYGLFWQKSLYNELKHDFPAQRPFNLTASGWAGSQRHGIGVKGEAGITAMINMSMSGIAYMHPAITATDNELEIRNLQFCTFTPILRNVSSTDLSSLKPPYNSIARKYVNLRYQLLPYIYTLAWQNTTTGRPIVLPIDYFTPIDEPESVYDQYLFGENLLVAPVSIPGMFQRQVYFPKGLWFNFWTNTLQEGGINPAPFIPVSPDNIPVYAKAGSIIPMATSLISSTDYYKLDSLMIKYFQDISVATNTFTLFHDDGADPNTLTNQRYEITDFVGHTYQDSVILENIQRQTFVNNLTSRALLVEFENFTSIPKSITINHKAVPVVQTANLFIGDNIAYYNLNAKQLKVRYSWTCAIPTKLVVQRDGLSVLLANEPQVSENQLKIYPNPSLNYSQLTIESLIIETGNYELEIFNAKGVSVYHTNLGKQQQGVMLKYAWNTENLTGVFFAKLQNDKGHISTKKIVIE